MNDIEVGGIVEVVNTGECYTTYEGWAQLHGLSKFRKGDMPCATEGCIYRVVATGLHKVEEEGVLLGIEDLNTKQQYIIGIKGVKLVKRQQPVTFDEFVKDCIEKGGSFKVRVTPETSKLIQETVFKYGGSWWGSLTIELLHVDEPFLHFEDKKLTYSSNNQERYFNDKSQQEISVTPVTTLEYKLVENKVKTKEGLEKEERLKKIKELEDKLEELRKLEESDEY